MAKTKKREGARRRPQAGDVDDLAKQLEPLARQLLALEDHARKLGIFVEHRDLVACRKCGLFEDVLAHGLHVVHHADARPDTGLRFIERKDGALVCPTCGVTAEKTTHTYDDEDHALPTFSSPETRPAAPATRRLSATKPRSGRRRTS